MIEFRQKNFDILPDIVRGATIGGTTGSAIAIFRNAANRSFDKDNNRSKEVARKDALNISIAGTLIGATLGAFVGGIKNIVTKINRKNTVDHRLMSKVIEVLKKDGFKEGTNFTKDPKTATSLRTKVCLVISKISGELRLSVNLVSDPRLKTVSNEIIKRLPNTSAVTEKMSDKYNDIIITSISDASADTGLIVGIIEKFIHSGYPVYLVEVG